MKQTLVLACLMVCAASCGQSADDKTIYLDSLGFETIEGNHVSYRVVEDYAVKKKEYHVKEFYKSGKLLLEGDFLDNFGRSETGVVTNYYENGNKEKAVAHAEGFPLGNYATWYDDGHKKEEGEYLKSSDKDKKPGPLKIYSFWNDNHEQTVIDGHGAYQEANNKFAASGPLKNGFKDGVWTGSDNLINYTFREIYANGKLVSGTSIDDKTVERTYTEVEIKPEFKGGLNEFYKFIAKNYRTPEQEGLSGKIIVCFHINADGKIADVNLIKDIGYGTGEEALRVMGASPDWKPGVVRGIPVRIFYSLPITIHSAD